MIPTLPTCESNISARLRYSTNIDIERVNLWEVVEELAPAGEPIEAHEWIFCIAKLRYPVFAELFSNRPTAHPSRRQELTFGLHG
jgi:hypothetical protein